MHIIWEQFTEQLILFFTDLNWRYIIIYVIIILGIKDNIEFKWWKNFLKKYNKELYASWYAGLILIIFFIVINYLEGDVTNATYISSLLRSYIVVIAFSDILVRRITKLGKPDKD